MSGGSFTGFRLLYNDYKMIAFELPFADEKMNAVKEAFKGQRIVVHYSEGKIKVYSAPHQFDTIIRALSVI